jgi:hypothetical protein
MNHFWDDGLEVRGIGPSSTFALGVRTVMAVARRRILLYTPIVAAGSIAIVVRVGTFKCTLQMSTSCGLTAAR